MCDALEYYLFSSSNKTGEVFTDDDKTTENL